MTEKTPLQYKLDSAAAALICRQLDAQASNF